jgi:hypothetical protein
VAAVRRRVRLLSLLAALALAAALVGCGGGSAPDVTVTVTTGGGTTATAPATATGGSNSTQGTASLGDRLPADDALPGLRGGDVRELPTAGAFVRALYQRGDPSLPAAQARFEAAGYDGAALKDQIGSDPSSGLALSRMYVARLRSPAEAQREVGESVEEVKRTSTAAARDVAVPGIPGARGLELTVRQGSSRARVLFLTFAGGRYLYGIQEFARADADFPQEEILRVARDLYDRYGSVP